MIIRKGYYKHLSHRNLFKLWQFLIGKVNALIFTPVWIFQKLKFLKKLIGFFFFFFNAIKTPLLHTWNVIKPYCELTTDKLKAQQQH